METTIKKQGIAKEVAKAKLPANQGLRDLFEGGLKDIYWAEKVLTKTLPKMAKNATTPELVTALNSQLKEKHEHVSRLEQIFKTSGIKPSAQKCEAMEGLLKESNTLMASTQMGVVRDAGLIAAGQKVKHYEIASYGTLHAYAKTLGEEKAAKLLEMTLAEEKKTDAILTAIAMSEINPNAADKIKI